MSYKALYRTYRPATFDEMAGQKHIVKTLKNAIEQNRIAHAYLFCGPRGTGKTSTAKIFARLINCESENKPCGVCDNCKEGLKGTHPDIIEIDAASNNGVEEARSLIDKIKYAPLLGKYKVYIIDEVHMMTKEAFNALLKTVEEPPEHVIFIMATTEPHKVLETILSRCQRFDFTKLNRKDIIGYLEKVIKEENIKVEDKVLENIAILADGGMRDALSILDQCRSYSPNYITLNDVREIYGIVSIQEVCELLEVVKNRNTKSIVQKIEKFDLSGSDIKRLTSDLLEVIKESIIFDYTKDETLLDVLTYEQVCQVRKNLSVNKRLEVIDILMDTLNRYKQTNNVISNFEIGLLKVMNILDSITTVSEKTEVIENKVVEQSKEETKIEIVEEEAKEEIVEEVNEEIYTLPDEDFVETIDEVSVKTKEEKMLDSDEFILSLLVGANKPERKLDIEKMRNVKNHLHDLEYGKYANLLKNKTIVASANSYILISVDSQILANEINSLDKKQEFLFYTQLLLEKRKKVFAITNEKASEVVELYRERMSSNTLPKAISFDVEEKKEEVKEIKDEKLEKIKSYFSDVVVQED